MPVQLRLFSTISRSSVSVFLSSISNLTYLSDVPTCPAISSDAALLFLRQIVLPDGLTSLEVSSDAALLFQRQVVLPDGLTSLAVSSDAALVFHSFFV